MQPVVSCDRQIEELLTMLSLCFALLCNDKKDVNCNSRPV